MTGVLFLIGTVSVSVCVAAGILFLNWVALSCNDAMAPV